MVDLKEEEVEYSRVGEQPKDREAMPSFLCLAGAYGMFCPTVSNSNLSELQQF